MKVEVKEEKHKSKYPYIGINDLRQIIIFVCPNSGTILCCDLHETGKYSSSWNEDAFKPFEGKITLSND